MFPEDDHNHLSDLKLFIDRTQPSAPENSWTNTGDSTNRPSSLLDINDTHRPALLSLFRLSASLPPHSKSIEPCSGGQERMQETNASRTSLTRASPIRTRVPMSCGSWSTASRARPPEDSPYALSGYLLFIYISTSFDCLCFLSGRFLSPDLR